MTMQVIGVMGVLLGLVNNLPIPSKEDNEKKKKKWAKNGNAPWALFQCALANQGPPRQENEDQQLIFILFDINITHARNWRMQDKGVFFKWQILEHGFDQGMGMRKEIKAISGYNIPINQRCCQGSPSMVEFISEFIRNQTNDVFPTLLPTTTLATSIGQVSIKQ